MARFRRFFRLAAVIAVLFSALTPALAQDVCTAFVANQPIMRQESVAEPAGEITLVCTVGALGLTGASTGTQTLSLYVFGATITSRQLSTGNSSGIATEAALLVNDCTANCTTGSPAQGFLQNGALVFTGFTLPTAANSTFIARITNVRVDANQQ